MVSLGRLYTVLRIIFLNMRGAKIKIGRNTVISRRASLIGNDIVLGDNCYVGCYTALDSSSGPIYIGRSTTFGRFCMVHGGVTVGDSVRIASHVVIAPSDHKFMDRHVLIKAQGTLKKEVSIGSDVWLSAGVKVLSGSVIDDGCVVGAGGVVKKHLEEYSVYVGVPVKKISERV